MLLRKLSLKYLLLTGLCLSLVFTGLFVWLSRQQERLILEQVKKQAIILHKQIVLTRRWVSDHNYVLIEKKGDVRSDPFLSNPDIQDVSGRVYTKITPAILTRCLSKYAGDDGLYRFDLTGVNCLNPANKPDPFEAQALTLFSSGKAKELSRIEVHQGRPVFRYAAPLVVQDSCLSCHHGQGFCQGDVGGCISVYLPMEQAQLGIKRNNVLLFSTMLGLCISVIGILFLFARRLFFKPISELREYTRKIREEEFGAPLDERGDDLKELANFCYLIDGKLKEHHRGLERKIKEATRDLSITNRKLREANEVLSRLNKAKTDFFSEISHELRTPLTAIKGAVDILSRKQSCEDPRYLEIIRKNAEYLIKSVTDMLEFARIEAGRLELELAPEELGPIIEEAVEAQRPLADSKSLHVELSLQQGCLGMVDRQRIYQVLTNLLSNAIKFSPRGAKVVVRLRAGAEGAQIIVEDEGPGIPEGYENLIFKKYYRINHSYEDKGREGGSSGIGLAICKALVEAHGGNIWVERAPGGGSRFIFTLPKTQPLAE